MGTPPDVLVVGAGMYVCGRGTQGFGTVLPTLAAAQARGDVREIAVAATTPESAALAREKLVAINARLGTAASVAFYPQRSPDPAAYRVALAALAQPVCAIVCVPDHLHASIAADLIEARAHVLVVKPLAPTLPEAARLVALAQAREVYGAVEFHKRFDEANLLLRQVVADGRLGDVLYVNVEYSQRRVVREIFRAWIARTSIFQYLGVHYVDLIQFVTGARPLRAMGTGQGAEVGTDGPGALDAIQAVVEWRPPTGPTFVSAIITNWIDPERSPAMSDQTITVVGNRGRYESDQTRRGVRLITEAGFEEVNPYFTQLYRGADGRPGVFGYGPRSIAQFLEDVGRLHRGEVGREDLVVARPSFEQALLSTAVIDAVHQSLASGGQWVSVEAMLQAVPVRSVGQ